MIELIEMLLEGNPMGWIILVGTIAYMIWVFKRFSRADEARKAHIELARSEFAHTSEGDLRSTPPPGATQIELTCVDSSHIGQQWNLCLSALQAQLTDSEGHTVSVFSPPEAAQRFQLPSFWKSAQHLSIYINDEWFQFQPPKQSSTLAIRDFVERGFAEIGPEALRPLQQRAVRGIVFGSLLALGGIAISVWFLDFAAGGGGAIAVFYGAIAVGVAKVVHGFQVFSRYKRLMEREAR